LAATAVVVWLAPIAAAPEVVPRGLVPVEARLPARSVGALSARLPARLAERSS